MGTSRITDDFELLDKMVTAMFAGPDNYPIDGPTKGLAENFIRDIKEHGLQKMISDGSRLLNTISGVSYSPLQQMHYNVNRQCSEGRISEEERDVLLRASEIIFNKSDVSLLPYELSMEQLNLAAYKMADLMGKVNNAKPLHHAPVSEELNIGYTYSVNDLEFNYVHYYYYLRYAFVAAEIDFNEVDTIIDLGSGSGRIIEVLKKLYPHLTCHLFDVGPQLYVANRFLNAVMPEQIVEFGSQKEEKGKIHFHPHYEIENFQPSGKTLSWNSMVYCIMEPPTAKSYLDKLGSIADWIYVCEPMTKAGGGQYGLEDPMTKQHYIDFLTPTHALKRQGNVSRALADIKLWGGVEEMLWKKS